MGRRKTEQERNAKRIDKAQRREDQAREDLDFIRKFGVHPKIATPRRIAEAKLQRERHQRRMREVEELHAEAMAKAKLLAVVPEVFEYCNLAPVSKEALVLFQSELKALLAPYEGKDEPEAVVDAEVRDYLQKAVERGTLKPAPVRAGTVPKARLHASGKVTILRMGEPDRDYIAEQLGNIGV
jgi:hypothetical protein